MNPIQEAYTQAEVLQLAADAYQTGRASFTLDLHRAALLIIDMQCEFVQPHQTKYWVPDATRIIPRLAELLEAARQAGLPIIHTAFGPTHLFRDRPRSSSAMPNRYPALPDAGFDGTPSFPPELTPRAGEIVLLKPSYGAFHDTPLDTILRNQGRDTVIITGTLTNLCCSTTARQAYERGYYVVFGEDVTATNDSAIHQAEIQTMRYGFARVADSFEIISSLKEMLP